MTQLPDVLDPFPSFVCQSRGGILRAAHEFDSRSVPSTCYWCGIRDVATDRRRRIAAARSKRRQERRRRKHLTD